MRRAVLLIPLAALALAGCGGGQHSELRAADDQACLALDKYGDTAVSSLRSGMPDDDALNALVKAYGMTGTPNDPLSSELSPRAELVGGEAQLLLSQEMTGNLDDPTRLAGFVSQMRTTCTSMGWKG